MDPTSGVPPVQLEALTVRRYRHLREPVHLDLLGGPVLLVGRNGTGKTNLLRLIDAVTRLDFRDLERDPRGLDLDFVLRWGDLRLHLAVKADPSVQSGRLDWRCSGRVEDPGHSVPFVVGESSPRPAPVLTERWFRSALAFHVSPTAGTVEPWMADLHGYTLLTGGTGRYDEALGAFSAITSADAPDRAALTIRDHRTLAGRGHSFLFCPVALARWLADKPAATRQVAANGDDLEFLATAARVCGFQDLSCAAQIDREEPEDQQVNTTYGPFVFRARLADGTTIAHHDFSFGQKRIVAFQWYLSCVRDEGGAVVADELVNGMHHGAVRELVASMSGLQAFLASQNPLLFDHMEYTSADDFQRRLILCESGAKGGWNWRPPTTDEAERFFRAHDIGYQHVHEILRDEGLW